MVRGVLGGFGGFRGFRGGGGKGGVKLEHDIQTAPRYF